MDYTDALKIVRSKHSNDLIRNFFEYNGKFIFAISKGKTYIEDDPSTYHVSIDSKTGKYALYDFWTELLDNKDPNFTKAINSVKAIDIPV